MSLQRAAKFLRGAAWLSPASFLLFMLSVIIITILPAGKTWMFALIEWGEMIIGTLLSLLVAVTILWFRKDRGSPLPRKSEWFAITGVCFWVIFWVLAVWVHHPAG